MGTVSDFWTGNRRCVEKEEEGQRVCLYRHWVPVSSSHFPALTNILTLLIISTSASGLPNHLECIILVTPQTQTHRGAQRRFLDQSHVGLVAMFLEQT